MAKNTSISWADHTFNPWLGCAKISPACDNCYAENLMDKRLHVVQWGANQSRERVSPQNWHQPIKWQKEAVLAQAAWQHDIELHSGNESACIANSFTKPKRPRVFCASLADVFDNAIDPQWRIELFDLINKTPALDWMLLTKRIGNAKAMIKAATENSDFHNGRVNFEKNPWHNVFIGATICNQAEADRDMPKLLATPAAKRFLSIEPMLGPVELNHLTPEPGTNQSGIDLVIVGGESGENARPMHPHWVTRIRDQCKGARVPFHFKQWGEWSTTTEHYTHWLGASGNCVDLDSAEGQSLWEDGIKGKENTKGYLAIGLVGTKNSGRALDGKNHDGEI
jgi:protein gp37